MFFNLIVLLSIKNDLIYVLLVSNALKCINK